MRNSITIFLLSILVCTLSSAQTAEVLSGPMPGHSTMRMVKVWLQTNQSSDVLLKYWPKDSMHLSIDSKTIQTKKEVYSNAEIGRIEESSVTIFTNLYDFIVVI